jgi:hypothetical protein
MSEGLNLPWTRVTRDPREPKLVEYRVTLRAFGKTKVVRLLAVNGKVARQKAMEQEGVTVEVERV